MGCGESDFGRLRSDRSVSSRKAYRPPNGNLFPPLAFAIVCRRWRQALAPGGANVARIVAAAREWQREAEPP